MRFSARFRPALLAATALVWLSAAGCGGVAGPKPQGKVLFNGEPYRLDSGETLQMTFIGEGEPGKQISAGAGVNPDGTFTVSGPANAGIPLGKYHITVQSTKYGPGGPSARMADKFQGRYSNAAQTQLTCEITSANQPIIIDLGKGVVTMRT